QIVVTFIWRHCGNAIGKGDLRGRARKTLGDDLTHPGARILLLLFADESQVTAHDHSRRNNIRLAGSGEALVCHLNFRATRNHRWIESQILFAAQRFVKLIENASCFEDGAAAHTLKNRGRVSGPGSDFERPVAAATPRDGGDIAAAVFKTEDEVTAFGGVDHVATADLHRIA